MKKCECEFNDEYVDQESEIHSEHLNKIAFHKDWSILYQCPTCHVYWEKQFPSGEHHGDGPSILKKVDTLHIIQKYNLEKSR